MRELQKNRDGLIIYDAGFPKYTKNFPRDGIISAMLASDVGMLRNQLIYCAHKQGTNNNPYNGEEPGKIFHEYPPATMRGLSTEFNACDTTALFLIGHEYYSRVFKDSGFLKEHKPKVRNSVDYILRHLSEDLYWESPEFCGSDKFALKVTYWKDSLLPDREAGEPQYPVVYTIAHIQNMCALRCAAALLDSNELAREAERMSKATRGLFDPDLGAFCIAIDKKGPIRGVNSDSLHGLCYLQPYDISAKMLSDIVKSSVILETPAGYRTMSPNEDKRMTKKYHSSTVWPFEQAMIHWGALKFGLEHVKNVSERVISYLSNDFEILMIEHGKIRPDGCVPQLWTTAARQYFMKRACDQEVIFI